MYTTYLMRITHVALLIVAFWLFVGAAALADHAIIQSEIYTVTRVVVGLLPTVECKTIDNIGNEYKTPASRNEGNEYSCQLGHRDPGYYTFEMVAKFAYLFPTVVESFDYTYLKKGYPEHTVPVNTACIIPNVAEGHPVPPFEYTVVMKGQNVDLVNTAKDPSLYSCIVFGDRIGKDVIYPVITAKSGMEGGFVCEIPPELPTGKYAVSIKCSDSTCETGFIAEDLPLFVVKWVPIASIIPLRMIASDTELEPDGELSIVAPSSSFYDAEIYKYFVTISPNGPIFQRGFTVDCVVDGGSCIAQLSRSQFPKTIEIEYSITMQVQLEPSATSIQISDPINSLSIISRKTLADPFPFVIGPADSSRSDLELQWEYGLFQRPHVSHMFMHIKWPGSEQNVTGLVPKISDATTISVPQDNIAVPPLHLNPVPFTAGLWIDRGNMSLPRHAPLSINTVPFIFMHELVLVSHSPLHLNESITIGTNFHPDNLPSEIEFDSNGELIGQDMHGNVPLTSVEWTEDAGELKLNVPFNADLLPQMPLRAWAFLTLRQIATERHQEIASSCLTFYSTIEFVSMAPYAVTYNLMHSGFDLSIEIDRGLPPDFAYFCRGVTGFSDTVPAVFRSLDIEDRHQFTCWIQVPDASPGDVYTFELVFQDVDDTSLTTLSRHDGQIHVVNNTALHLVPSEVPAADQLRVVYDIPHVPYGTWSEDYMFSLRISPVWDVDKLDRRQSTVPCFMDSGQELFARIMCLTPAALSGLTTVEDFRGQTLQEFHIDLLINGQLAIRQVSVKVFQEPVVTRCAGPTSAEFLSLEQTAAGGFFVSLEGRHLCDAAQPIVARYTLTWTNGTKEHFDTQCMSITSASGETHCSHIECPVPNLAAESTAAVAHHQSSSIIGQLQLTSLLVTNYRYAHMVTCSEGIMQIYRASSVRLLQIVHSDVHCNFPSRVEIVLDLENLHDTGSVEVQLAHAHSADGPSARFRANVVSLAHGRIVARGTLLLPSTVSTPLMLNAAVSLDGGLTWVADNEIEFICAPNASISVVPHVVDSSAQSLSGIAVSLYPPLDAYFHDQMHFEFELPNGAVVPTVTSWQPSGTQGTFQLSTMRQMYGVVGPVTLRPLLATNVSTMFGPELATTTPTHMLTLAHFKANQLMEAYAASNIRFGAITPTKLAVGITNTVSIDGSGFPVHLDATLLCAKIAGHMVPEIQMVDDTRIVLRHLAIMDMPHQVGSVTIEVSFDGCRTFFTAASSIAVHRALRVRALSDAVYSFTDRPLTEFEIEGLPIDAILPDDVSVAVRFGGESGGFTVILPSSEQLQNGVQLKRTDCDQVFEFGLPQDVNSILPRSEELNGANPSTVFRFPMEHFYVGFSMDKIHYSWERITLRLSFPLPTLLGVESPLDRLIPVDADGSVRRMTFIATEMNLARNYSCIFTIPDSEEQFYSAVLPVDSTNAVRWSCAVPSLSSPGQVRMNLRDMSDQFGGLAAGDVLLHYYEIPALEDVMPRSAPMQGGSRITVRARQTDPSLKLHVHFDNAEATCDTIGHNSQSGLSELSCVLPPSPIEVVHVRISYNLVDWYSSDGDEALLFRYEQCPPGYEAASHVEACTPCRPGTYKPTAGLYSCFPCLQDTFASQPGSIYCTDCPINTLTLPRGSNGKTSVYDCQCALNFMVNPDHVLAGYVAEEAIMSSPDSRCHPCPQGGNCNSTLEWDSITGQAAPVPRYNTTLPHALPGFWFDPQVNHTLFYMCNPRSSCPGGSNSNCTSAYTGTRCGQCSLQHYRLRNECLRCSGDAWIRLLLFIAALAVLVCAFFLFSSISISHISAVSIGFSFWQIISIFSSFDIPWPSAVDTSFTAASALNFNTDFLNMQCIFPQMGFVTKWIVALAFPVACFFGFVVFYICSELRSLMARLIGRRLFGRFQYWHTVEMQLLHRKDQDRSSDRTRLDRMLRSVRRWFSKRRTMVVNGLIYTRNLMLWIVKQDLTRKQHKIALNKCINSFFTFLSFSFIFMMTQSSIIFKCTQQTDGSWTMDQSPDIKCFEGRWFIMLPVTLFYWVTLGLGSVVLFTYLYLTRSRLQHDLDYQERFKFILRRYKTKHFYWELVVTLRKFFISICYTFLPPMLTVVCCMGVVFVSLLLHMEAIPYNKKAHNMLEYFILVATLVILAFGLLFFVDQFPEPWMKDASAMLAIVVIVATSAVVVMSMLWDIRVRKKKQKKKVKALERQAMQDLNRMSVNDRVVIMEMVNKSSMSLHKAKKLFEMRNQHASFTLPLYEVEVYDSDEDSSDSLNELLGGLFSMRRLQRKVFLLNRKRRRVEAKMKKVTETVDRQKDAVLDKGRSFYRKRPLSSSSSDRGRSRGSESETAVDGITLYTASHEQ